MKLMLADTQSSLLGIQASPTAQSEITQPFSGLFQQNLDADAIADSQVIDSKMISNNISELEEFSAVLPHEQPMPQWSALVDSDAVMTVAISDAQAGTTAIVESANRTQIAAADTGLLTPGNLMTGEPLPASGNRLPQESDQATLLSTMLTPRKSVNISAQRSTDAVTDTTHQRSDIALQQQTVAQLPKVQLASNTVPVSAVHGLTGDAAVTTNSAVKPDSAMSRSDRTVTAAVTQSNAAAMAQADSLPAMMSPVLRASPNANSASAADVDSAVRPQAEMQVKPGPVSHSDEYASQVKLNQQAQAGTQPRHSVPPLEPIDGLTTSVKSVPTTAAVTRLASGGSIDNLIQRESAGPVNAKTTPDISLLAKAEPSAIPLTADKESIAPGKFELTAPEQAQFELPRATNQAQNQQHGMVQAGTVAAAPLSGSSNIPLLAQPHADALILTRNADTSEWGNGIGERVNWMINQKLNSATIRLDPPALGRLDVQVRLADDATIITIHTQLAQTRDLVEASVHRLREFLQENGYQNVSVDVSHRQDQQQARSQHLPDSENRNPDDSGQGNPTDSDDNQPIQYFSGDGLVDTFA